MLCTFAPVPPFMRSRAWSITPDADKASRFCLYASREGDHEGFSHDSSYRTRERCKWSVLQRSGQDQMDQSRGVTLNER